MLPSVLLEATAMASSEILKCLLFVVLVPCRANGSLLRASLCAAALHHRSATAARTCGFIASWPVVFRPSANSDRPCCRALRMAALMEPSEGIYSVIRGVSNRVRWVESAQSCACVGDFSDMFKLMRELSAVFFWKRGKTGPNMYRKYT